MMKLKYWIILIVVASFAAIGYGFYLKPTHEVLGHRFIGSGTLGLFFVAMPLFLVKESRGKKMQDYMLTQENIEKMRNNEQQSRKNDNSDKKND